MHPKFRPALLALALTLAPVTAFAQTETDTASPTAPAEVGTTTEGVEERREGGFPWGLLGLLGLAGLAGRQKAEQPRTEVRLGGPTDGPRRS